MAVVRQSGEQSSFGVAYAFGDRPTVAASRLDTGSDMVAYQFKQGDVIARLCVSDKPGEWAASSETSDAQVLYVRTENGKPAELSFIGGTLAKSGETEVRIDAGATPTRQPRAEH